MYRFIYLYIFIFIYTYIYICIRALSLQYLDRYIYICIPQPFESRYLKDSDVAGHFGVIDRLIHLDTFCFGVSEHPFRWSTQSNLLPWLFHRCSLMFLYSILPLMMIPLGLVGMGGASSNQVTCFAGWPSHPHSTRIACPVAFPSLKLMPPRPKNRVAFRYSQLIFIVLNLMASFSRYVVIALDSVDLC